MLDLQKANRELRKDLTNLQKEFEATSSQPAVREAKSGIQTTNREDE